jgi:hypothetical protein
LGNAVLIRHLAPILAAAVTLASLETAPAIARQWKATPEAIARDYATINDTRPGGELVLLMWFVPQMIPPSSPGAEVATTMLRKYVVVMAVHGHLDRATLNASFEDIIALQASDQNGRALTPIAKNDLPPASVALLTAMEALFRQSAGALGNGMKLFVFDGAGIDSCSKGRLLIPLADETYTWDTPFPSCQQN